jgi:hypothetical protein
VQEKTGPSDATASGRSRSRNLLEERCRRVVDTVREKDLRNFHVDMEARGPVGRVMEARTSVFGIMFLVTTGVRFSGVVSTAIGTNVSQAHQAGVQALWTNASFIAIVFLFVGFIVSAITAGGKEDAMLSEKVHDARDALEDKIVSAMGRFVNDELDSVKTLLVNQRAEAIARLDRAIDANKQECEELERKGRGTTWTSRAGRTGLAPLPVTFRSDVDKVTLAARDVRADLAVRLAPN